NLILVQNNTLVYIVSKKNCTMDENRNILKIGQKLPKIEVYQGTYETSTEFDLSDSDEE
ncbi:hypothetical protein EWB00_000337, partial [Schistosoma japonicum]